MTWKRSLQIGTGLAIASTAISALLWPAPAADDADAPAVRWGALPDDQKRELLGAFEAYSQPEQFQLLLAYLKEFERYERAQRERWVRLAERLAPLVGGLPPRTRAQLQALPHAAQAVQLYHLLEQSDPAALDSLAREFAGLE